MSITLGNTTISGLAVGGLPSGTVNSSSLAAGAITPSKIGFSGCFLQTTISTYQSPWASGVSGNSWYNLPLSGSITPQFSSSRILVMTNLALWHNNSATIRILRNGSSVYQGANNNSNTAGTYHHALPFFPDGNHVDGRSYAFIDSPGTTSSISYTMQAYGESSTTAYVNCSSNGYNNSNNSIGYLARGCATMLLIEVA